MKDLIFCAVLFVLLGAAVNAQPAQAERIIAETSALSEKIVKGSPFSAAAVNESVQVLADGNRIVRSSTNKLYRNSEGRFRREISGTTGGALGTFYTVGPGITILDPIQGYRFLLDSHLKTARVGSLSRAALATAPVPPASPVRAAEAAVIAERQRAELAAAAPAAVITPNAKITGELVAAGQRGPFVTVPPARKKYESRMEDLGVQTIEGVEARGTRTVTTIPAGDIGNERPIEMVYEKWYSDELQLVVMSKHSDPRFGEQTYRLTNIVRAEPDPSLFELPQGYKVLTEPGGSFTFSTGKGQGQTTVWTKSSGGSGTSTTVRTSKP